jgi:hypothetical protein
VEYIIKHFEDGYQVFQKEGEAEELIASFHKGARTRTGEKSLAQRRAEEYCDFLNQKDLKEGFSLDFDKD